MRTKITPKIAKAIEEVLRRYVASALELAQESRPVDRAKIIPIVKDRGWLEETNRSLQQRGLKDVPERVFEEFSEGLVLVYAEDSPTSIRYLTMTTLKELGLALTDLRPLAAENLIGLLPDIEIHQGPLVSMITAGGTFEASLLALPSIWQGFEKRVDGDIVVAIPSRDLLLLTGSKTPGGVAKLRELAAKAYRDSSYSLTDALYIRKNGRFVRLPER